MRNSSDNTFRQALLNRERLFFDGGIGSMLQARGLPAGVSPEAFCLERPEVMYGIHEDYAAVADVITTNTFGGSPYKLPPGLDVTDFNRRMAALAREAADKSGRRVFVAGSVGPCGHFLRPMGEVEFGALVAAFRAQIRGLVLGGADLVQIETQIDVAEARAAVIAARQECDLPVSVSMTFEDSMTLTGSTPELCASLLANLGVDIIATNCSAGPEQMLDTVERLLAASAAPVLVQPNAGLPELVDGKTVFRLEPERFAELTAVFAEKGVQLLGGCCGTTPDHIRALRRAVGGIPVRPPRHEPSGSGIYLSSRTALVRVGAGQGFRLIGERINPTGKKQLSADLVNGEFSVAFRYADEQIRAGAGILDVNVGAPMVDEEKILPDLVSMLVARYQAPLSLDSSNAKAIEAALAFCPASPLVNSISGEPGRMEFLGPVCRDYGAPFILLPLKGAKLPETAKDRIAILDSLLDEMDRLGVPRRLALVDVLVLSVSAKPMAAAECFKFIRHCADIGLPTVAGLSNISFGLPARELVNASFLSMAAAHGLNAAIANPGSARIRESVASANLLLGRDKDAEDFIAGYSGWTPGSGGTGSAGPAATGATGASGTSGPAGGGAATLESAVIEGLREDISALVDEALAKGGAPFAIVNDRLIPAITEVGRKYEKKEYFLPQLLRSAETMQAAFAKLRPLLEKDARSGEKPKVITATVEGDIHDIGKNIVNLMLGNHGFEVIDLGKDVPAEEIVESAVRHNCRLVGLSALMTTTMVRMRDTIDLLRARNISNIKVMVGGAVVTRNFADSIGADGYAADAVEAVRVAKSLLSPPGGGE